MFSAVEKHLESDEVLEDTINPSPFDSHHVKWYLIAAVIAAGIASGIWYAQQNPDILPSPAQPLWLAAGFVIPLLIVIAVEVHRNFVFYHFTDRKIIKERGVLSKTFLTVHYHQITETRLDQVIHERIFDVGDLHINTAGTDAVEMVLNGVKDPEHYKVKVSSKSSVAHMPHQAPKQLTGTSVPEDALEAELGKIQRRRQNLEASYADQKISGWQYEREWYMLEGEERIIQSLLDRLDGSGGAQ